jgi:hypothetical protein
MSKKDKTTQTTPTTPAPPREGKTTPNPSKGGELGWEFQKTADELFATHSCTAFYFTVDGTAFSEKNHARLHAANLNDDKIITIKKQETA